MQECPFSSPVTPRYTEFMAFVIDDAFLPATLSAQPMTDEEFAAFCAEHPDLFFEMTAEGEIIVMPPTYSSTGVRNTKINRQLDVWAEKDDRGVTCDSSSGFVLPNGARRSPDASWTLRTRIEQLAPSGEILASLPRLRDRVAVFHRSPACRQGEDVGMDGKRRAVSLAH
jgi:hypothetical protein